MTASNRYAKEAKRSFVRIKKVQKITIEQKVVFFQLVKMYNLCFSNHSFKFKQLLNICTTLVQVNLLYLNLG